MTQTKKSIKIEQTVSKAKPMEKRTEAPQFPFAQLLSGKCNLSQFRMDLWNRCRELSTRLDEAKRCNKGNIGEIKKLLQNMFYDAREMERFWFFPGETQLNQIYTMFQHADYDLLAKEMNQVVHFLSRFGDYGLRKYEEENIGIKEGKERQYFTVLCVDNMPLAMQKTIRHQLRQIERNCDDFIYDVVYVSSFEDAILAILNNEDIQACVIRHDIPLRSLTPVLRAETESIHNYVDQYHEYEHQSTINSENEQDSALPRGPALGKLLRELRPQLDLYLMTDQARQNISDEINLNFDRIFYRHEDFTEVHMTVLEGVRIRYKTPFFNSLKRYAEKPVGNFHALPIARGHSVFNSKWLTDMRDFYGDNIFLAESSSTTGGLDSLLSPKGSIKEAQEKAAKTFGSKQTYFVTNGTSTSNKIVVQALTQPGDIVLIDRNCHKSHHYGMVLGGAFPLYLEAYPLDQYSMYGGVPLKTIKETLLKLKAEGRLDKVKMLLLTNCTFDGIVYNPIKVMEEVLAIKPDICFLWDEAWFGYARLFPTTRQRTAMFAADFLEKRYKSESYREKYQAWKTKFKPDSKSDQVLVDETLMADPDQARIRVYATQSTHKSLSALRQGSMLHIYDEDFKKKTEDAFHEAYFTHTSTSPNYQLIASLDLARRQVDLEGYALSSSIYQKAMLIREIINTDAEISKYFKALTPAELIPDTHCNAKEELYKMYSGDHQYSKAFDDAWKNDEFALDPTRVTIYTANAALGGDEFKEDILMNKFDIQVNKTALNSVLVIATIGATWSSVDYLIESFRRIARMVAENKENAGLAEQQLIELKIKKLTNKYDPSYPYPTVELPNFSSFHPAFRPSIKTAEGNIRDAYFLNYNTENRRYIHLADALKEIKEKNKTLVCTNFIIPYPPGFPILVPGQVISESIIKFMQVLDIKEIHGYHDELGLPVFKEEVIEALTKNTKKGKNKEKDKALA